MPATSPSATPDDWKAQPDERNRTGDPKSATTRHPPTPACFSDRRVLRGGCLGAPFNPVRRVNDSCGFATPPDEFNAPNSTPHSSVIHRDDFGVIFGTNGAIETWDGRGLICGQAIGLPPAHPFNMELSVSALKSSGAPVTISIKVNDRAFALTDTGNGRTKTVGFRNNCLALGGTGEGLVLRSTIFRWRPRPEWSPRAAASGARLAGELSLTFAQGGPLTQAMTGRGIGIMRGSASIDCIDSLCLCVHNGLSPDAVPTFVRNRSFWGNSAGVFPRLRQLQRRDRWRGFEQAER